MKQFHFQKKYGFLIGAAAFAALFLFAGIMFYREYSDQKQSADAFSNIVAMVQTEPAQETVPEEHQNIVAEIAPKETHPEMTVYEKYAAVYEQNHDFVGWVSIDDTNINYPVVQSPDEPNFYLKHAFDRSYSDYGVPYVQENCTLGQSGNIVIYGHHMNNGSMFADLCNYEKQDFYESHKTIRFDTLESFGTYEIIAVFKTVAYSENGFKYYHFVDADSETAFDDYIAQCKALSLYDTGVTAEFGDGLITLSTCEYSRTNGRMVVVAKLVSNDAGD